jgi:hypothetical protein
MLIGLLTGLVGLSSLTLVSLQKSSLKFYFWTLRRWHKFKNTKTKWRLAVRYDGSYDSELIGQFKNDLVARQNRLGIKVRNVTNFGINFIVNESLNFYLEHHPRKFTGLDYDFLSLELPKVEVGYNDANNKLTNEIAPWLEECLSFFKPENQSYELQVEFDGSNPFFSAYIKHLKPELVDDFQIRLRAKSDKINSQADSILIDKEKIHITSRSINAMKELAKDFLLFSPQIKKLGRG